MNVISIKDWQIANNEPVVVNQIDITKPVKPECPKKATRETLLWTI